MIALTAEEWKKVENELSPPLGHVKLKIDGYEIDILVVEERKLKYCYSVYVNGKIKGEWLINDCEERRRFMNVHKKSLMSQKEKAALMKRRMKKADKERILSKAVYFVYEPYFTSFSRMKSHLVKNNKSIELAGGNV